MWIERALVKLDLMQHSWSQDKAFVFPKEHVILRALNLHPLLLLIKEASAALPSMG